MSETRKKYNYGFRIEYRSDVEQPEQKKLSYIYSLHQPDIRVISFKGGGSRVFVYGKFIELAQQRGLLNTVEEVGGSSTGCIAAAFTAVPYQDPAKRSATLKKILETDYTDIYTNTRGWWWYRTLAFPLNLISRPLLWLGGGLNWLADKFNKRMIGKIVGIPLSILGGIANFFSTITSPRFYAGAFNLIAYGGIYRGDTLENVLKNSFRSDTQTALHALLEKMTDEQRFNAITRLTEIGLGKMTQRGFVVNYDITFKHLYELSKLPGSQFKQLYITAVRVRDKQLVIFNKDNFPDMPVYKAMRLGFTFPVFIQKREYQGEKYFDGGALDNSPVTQASTRSLSRHEQEYGITDNEARLNVRVEYSEDYLFHLWKKPKVLTLIEQAGLFLKTQFSKLFTYGIDTYATDAVDRKIMQDDFPQRTLQLPDFGIDRMQTKFTNAQTRRYDKVITERCNEFFTHYFEDEEGAKVRAVVDPPCTDLNYMSLEKRRRLLAYLQDKDIKTETIYDIPGMDANDLEDMRTREIENLQTMPEKPFDYMDDPELREDSVLTCESGNTAAICRKLEVWPENILPEKTKTVKADNFVSPGLLPTLEELDAVEAERAAQRKRVA